MAARLILNADDFGLTHGVNRAVLELHRVHAITSATLMANGPAFDDAVAIAHANPSLGVGCHIVLTDGTPLSHPQKIPTLLGGDGKTFRSSLADFFIAALIGQINPDEVAIEALAQIQRLQQARIDVTHVDTHKHTHIRPQIARPILFACERTGVNAVRNPCEQKWSLALGTGSVVRKMQVRLLAPLRHRFQSLAAIYNRRILTTHGTIGISATGNLDADTLQQILNALPDGLWELVCHPGYNDRELDAVTTRLRVTRDIERKALLQIFSSPHQGVELVNFGSLGSVGAVRALARKSVSHEAPPD